MGEEKKQREACEVWYRAGYGYPARYFVVMVPVLSIITQKYIYIGSVCKIPDSKQQLVLVYFVLYIRLKYYKSVKSVQRWVSVVFLVFRTHELWTLKMDSPSKRFEKYTYFRE